jgi:hypothetical protein
MQSKWFELKSKALLLRRNGKSIKYINKLLGIPMSTLSGWLKGVQLTKKQKQILDRNWRLGLIKARKKAVVWHNRQRKFRLKEAESEADKVLQKIEIKDKNIVDLALAMLYLGEGFKSQKTGMGNSDPLILKFFLKIMINLYHLDINKISFNLHLRADQNPKAMKMFWSKELNVPIERFGKISIDKRTEGKTTYNTYKGVCVVSCANIAIQRKLDYLSKYYCEKVIKICALSSVGRASL